LGPFIKTKDDNLYVVTVTDGYSKYSVIKAGPSVEAGPTITFLKEFISNYGRPERIISAEQRTHRKRLKIFVENSTSNMSRLLPLHLGLMGKS
jgi:hypothetical protein